MAVGFTSRAEAPLETETTCSGARTTRCASAPWAAARPNRRTPPRAGDRRDTKATRPRRRMLTVLPEMRGSGLLERRQGALAATVAFDHRVVDPRRGRGHPVGRRDPGGTGGRGAGRELVRLGAGRGHRQRVEGVPE